MNSDAAMNAKVGDKVKIRYDAENSISSEIVYIKEDDDCKLSRFSERLKREIEFEGKDHGLE